MLSPHSEYTFFLLWTELNYIFLRATFAKFLFRQVIKCVGIFFRGNDPDRLNRPYTAGTKCGQCPRSCKSPCFRRTCHLCTNACSYSDLWLNCGQLNQAWNEWLCNTKTKEGVERFKNCRATCQCVNEIT